MNALRCCSELAIKRLRSKWGLFIMKTVENLRDPQPYMYGSMGTKLSGVIGLATRNDI
jgi:hypothetical protein